MKDYKLEVHAVGGEVVIKAVGVGVNNHVSMTMDPTKALELSMALMRAASAAAIQPPTNACAAAQEAEAAKQAAYRQDVTGRRPRMRATPTTPSWKK